VTQVWPVGIANIGPRIYFLFMAINLFCVPVVYLLYPETKGRRLEEMDALFGGKLVEDSFGGNGLVSGAEEEHGIFPQHVDPSVAKNPRSVEDGRHL
jgi:hypothetical protein